MAKAEETSTVADYFAPSPNRAQVDRAALIVALVQGRESATRTDYAHPRIQDIVRILDQAAGSRGK